MAHPKAVPVSLGGQVRHLVYDFNALCRLRDVGVDAFKLGEQEMEDPRVIRALIWAGLLEEFPDTTLAEVGKWMDLSNLAEMASAFTEAFQRSTKQENPDPQ